MKASPRASSTTFSTTAPFRLVEFRFLVYLVPAFFLAMTVIGVVETQGRDFDWKVVILILLLAIALALGYRQFRNHTLE